MKKTLSILFLILAVLSVFVGCDNDTPANPNNGNTGNTETHSWFFYSLENEANDIKLYDRFSGLDAALTVHVLEGLEYEFKLLDAEPDWFAGSNDITKDFSFTRNGSAWTPGKVSFSEGEHVIRITNGSTVYILNVESHKPYVPYNAEMDEVLEASKINKFLTDFSYLTEQGLEVKHSLLIPNLPQDFKFSILDKDGEELEAYTAKDILELEGDFLDAKASTDWSKYSFKIGANKALELDAKVTKLSDCYIKPIKEDIALIAGSYYLHNLAGRGFSFYNKNTDKYITSSFLVDKSYEGDTVNGTVVGIREKSLAEDYTVSISVLGKTFDSGDVVTEKLNLSDSTTLNIAISYNGTTVEGSASITVK